MGNKSSKFTYPTQGTIASLPPRIPLKLKDKSLPPLPDEPSNPIEASQGIQETRPAISNTPPSSAHSATSRASNHLPPTSAPTPRPRDLFLPLCPAYFSPTIPNITIDKWIYHGGTILPTPSDTAPTQTILRSNSFVFVIPDDPMLSSLRYSDTTMMDVSWIDHCVHAGELLGIEEYVIPIPAGTEGNVEEVKKFLEGLARDIEIQGLEQRKGGSQKGEEGSIISIPKKQKYILQPYLQLDLQEQHTSSKSKQSPMSLDIEQGGLPTFSFMLDVDLPAGLNINRLSDEEMDKLLKEIVEDASCAMEGDIRYWDGEGEITTQVEIVGEDKQGLGSRVGAGAGFGGSEIGGDTSRSREKATRKQMKEDRKSKGSTRKKKIKKVPITKNNTAHDVLRTSSSTHRNLHDRSHNTTTRSQSDDHMKREEKERKRSRQERVPQAITSALTTQNLRRHESFTEEEEQESSFDLLDGMMEVAEQIESVLANAPAEMPVIDRSKGGENKKRSREGIKDSRAAKRFRSFQDW